MTEQTPGPAPEPENPDPAPAAEEPDPAPAPEAEPQAAPVAAAAEHPAYSYTSYPGWAPPAPARASRTRRRTALLAAGALVAVAALGGGYVLFQRGDADAATAKPAAPTATPTPTATFGVTSGGTHYGYLGQMLLPRGDDYEPGADFEQYGDDSVLDAAKAKAMLLDAQGGPDMSKSERKEAGAELDAMHIKGAALRTYRTEDTGDQYLVMLTQVGNKLAARSDPENFRKFTKDSDFVKKGPAVPRYPHAVCVLPGNKLKESDDRFDWYDTMYCEATEGDLVIQFQADGVRPMEQMDAARFLARQLDRIKAPGESI